MSDRLPTYDPTRAKAAFEAVLPRLSDIPAGEVAQLNVDLKAAAVVALGVAELAGSPGVRPLYESLPKEVFDIRHLNDLPDLAWAAWHARLEGMTASASAREAMLPAPLVEKAAELRSRMLRVVGYYLEDHPDAGAEVASIRSGVGYLDQAADLGRLSALYEEHREAIEDDPRWYRPEDAGEARRTSAEILRHLGSSGDDTARMWADRQARIWTLLRRCYDEVRDTGRYIFRQDPRRKRFPSLHAAIRSRSRSPARAPATADEPAPGVGDTP